MLQHEKCVAYIQVHPMYVQNIFCVFFFCLAGGPNIQVCQIIPEWYGRYSRCQTLFSCARFYLGETD